jgi:predicted small metal-binding protein
MAMRTIECNICGEPVTSHDDEALIRRLVEHVRSAHPDAPFDEDRARAEVAAEAYSATDN